MLFTTEDEDTNVNEVIELCERKSGNLSTLAKSISQFNKNNSQGQSINNSYHVELDELLSKQQMYRLYKFLTTTFPDQQVK